MHFARTPDICVSYYLNDIEWLSQYYDRCIFYDKSWAGAPVDNHGSTYTKAVPLTEKYPDLKVVRSSVNGYNIYDYLQYIIDFYDVLPDVVFFLKGNTFPRHCSRFKVEHAISAGLIDKFHDNPVIRNSLNLNVAGARFVEANTSWYADQGVHPVRYFASYKEFFNFCFPKQEVPDFLQFTPGACFSTEASNIKKYPLNFYRNLQSFVAYSRLPSEALFLERSLETIFIGNYKLNDILFENLTDEKLNYLIDNANRTCYPATRRLRRSFWKAALKFSGYFFVKSINNLKG